MSSSGQRQQTPQALGLDQPNLQRLVEQIRSSQGIVPFVGAGLSVPFSLPTWRRFLLDLGKQANNEKDVTILLDEGKYEDAAELLLDALGPLAFHDALEGCFGDRTLAEPGNATAAALLPRLSHGPVITTNFDRVLELVFQGAGQPFERVIPGSTSDSVSQALQLGRRYLLKIHGDVGDREHRILTRSEYDAHYGSLTSDERASGSRSRLLQRMVESRSLLFVGCSLNDDRTVEVLRHAAGRSGSFVHYAILPEPDNASDKGSRIRFLSDRGIRPIWYPPHRHDLVVSLLEHVLDEIQAPDATPLSPLASSEEFFGPLLSATPNRLFHHNWDLVGRRDVLDRLHTWIDSDQKPVAMISGRGGIGKSKLLQGLSAEFSEDHSDKSLRFVLSSSPLSADDLDLRTGVNVIVVDDAHGRDDLGVLLQFARRHAGRVKLLLTSRPYRSGSIHSKLGQANFDTREVEDIGELGQLSRVEIRNLACQALGKGNGALADRLVAVTRDSPLVTVLGGQLLAERSIAPELIERDEEFRRVLLNKFQDELVGNVSDHYSPELIRKVLQLIAAVSPVYAEDQQFQDIATSFLGIDGLELLNVIDELEGAGVLLRRGRTVRITPDVLADHVLHTACVRSNGLPTGYAEQVFDVFRPYAPARVLVNLAELDWRIRLAQDDSALLDSIWATLQAEVRFGSPSDRYRVLRMLEEVAYHQPARILDIVQYAMQDLTRPTDRVSTA